MQNTEGGRKLNQAMASTGRAVATTGKAVGKIAQFIDLNINRIIKCNIQRAFNNTYIYIYYTQYFYTQIFFLYIKNYILISV